MRRKAIKTGYASLSKDLIPPAMPKGAPISIAANANIIIDGCRDCGIISVMITMNMETMPTKTIHIPQT